MSNFQLLSIVFLGIFAINQVKKLAGQPFMKIIYGFRWLVITIIAAIIIAFPEISTQISNFFGIGRGADLVLYFSLLWLLHKSYTDSKNIKELWEKIDNLTRLISLNSKKTQMKSTHVQKTQKNDCK